jgi:hypothetical protein
MVALITALIRVMRIFVLRVDQRFVGGDGF